MIWKSERTLYRFSKQNVIDIRKIAMIAISRNTNPQRNLYR